MRYSALLDSVSLPPEGSNCARSHVEAVRTVSNVLLLRIRCASYRGFVDGKSCGARIIALCTIIPVCATFSLSQCLILSKAVASGQRCATVHLEQ